MAVRYEEFTKKLSDGGAAIVPKDAQRIRGYRVEEYRELARRTERIDYDCDFRSDGSCRGRESGEKGCCWRCATTFGHWLKEEGPLDEDTARQIAAFFDPITGFCHPETGCVLPRELRSPTCLFIYCSDAKMSGSELDLLYQIRNGKSWS